jgi:regulator of sirC expression with transglutaminase-like and TPR domain
VSEADAVAQLLADPDPGIATSLRRQLVMREADPPGLREAVEALPDPLDRSRAREARLEIGRERAAERLLRLGAAPGELDFEAGTFEIALMEDPDRDVALAREKLDALAKGATLVVPGGDPRSRLIALSAFLGDAEGFSGDRSPDEVPRLSSLPDVLERRRGLPIALSAVYLCVARRIGVELYGVGAPLHFIVVGPTAAGPLYLDPFENGRPLEPGEAAAMLRRLGVVFRPEHLAPTRNRAIVARMARNLVAFYANRPRAEHRARRYARVAMALEEGP